VITSIDIKDLASEYEAATSRFIRAAGCVPVGFLDAGRPDGWSVRQIIHHLADSETLAYIALRRLLTEPTGSLILGFDEDRWARTPVLGYAELPVGNSRAIFESVRASSLDLIRRLSIEDLEHVGQHNSVGIFSVRAWLVTYIAHPREHADQLERARESNP